MFILVLVRDPGKQGEKLATVGCYKACDWTFLWCFWNLPWVSPLVWLFGSLNQTITPCHSDLTCLPLWLLLDQGHDFYGSGGGAVSILGSSVELRWICLPRVQTLMKHPFPWSQPAFLLSSLSTKAESRAFSYDIAELIMLLYWFCEPLSHRGMWGWGWVQRS